MSEIEVERAGDGTLTEKFGQKVKSLKLMSGLRGRLLLLTIVFVLVAEFLIFIPSISKFRADWFAERIQAAEIAAIALEASPNGKVSQELSNRLLQETQLLAVAFVDDEMRELVFSPQMPIESMPITVDLRRESKTRSFFRTLEHAFAKDGRILRVLAETDHGMAGTYIDIIVPEAALREDLLAFSVNILLLSLLISAVTATLISWSLYRLVVRPMIRITDSVVEFGAAPERSIPIELSGREDEIGKAEKALNEMQQTVSQSFRQSKRLAELGEAVAKISHDLRNSLSVARLATDSLQRSSDPRVKSAAPRLERAIERAVGLAEATLRYGKTDTPKAHMQRVILRDGVEEALLEGMSGHDEIDWLNDIDESVHVLADPEMLHRLIANLTRNAAQAIEKHIIPDESGFIHVASITDGEWIHINVEDNGPGIPEHLQKRLFQPFSTSDSINGTGLGLAITLELAQAMGGHVALLRTGSEGTCFQVKLKTGVAS